MPAYVRLKWVGGGPIPDTLQDDVYRLTDNTPFVRAFPLSGNNIKVQVDDDKLPLYTTPAIIDSLRSGGYELHLGPAEQAKLTIVARNVDQSLLQKDEASLKADIAARNEVSISTLTVIRQRKLLKIKLSNLTDATKLQTSGILAFYTRIPTYNIMTDTYVDLKQCFKCYQYGHRTSGCGSVQVCSKCAELGHFYTACTTNTQKCINCDGQHVAVSHACPIRREIIKNGRAAASQPPPPQPTTVILPVFEEG